MIRLQLNQLNPVQDAQAMLQTAIGVEFGTLPPLSAQGRCLMKSRAGG